MMWGWLALKQFYDQLKIAKIVKNLSHKQTFPIKKSVHETKWNVEHKMTKKTFASDVTSRLFHHSMRNDVNKKPVIITKTVKRDFTPLPLFKRMTSFVNIPEVKLSSNFTDVWLTNLNLPPLLLNNSLSSNNQHFFEMHLFIFVSNAISLKKISFKVFHLYSFNSLC